jgi:hypothetical protein
MKWVPANAQPHARGWVSHHDRSSLVTGLPTKGSR